jgi:hypothetical protein
MQLPEAAAYDLNTLFRTGATLDLDRSCPSLRYVLDGRLLENGTILEVQLAGAGGGWLPLRYEARWMEDGGEDHAGLLPGWHVFVATRDGQAGVELH